MVPPNSVPPAELEFAPGLIAPWHAASAATTDEAVLTAMRILIVDDQAFNIAVISGLLREAGYRTSSAPATRAASPRSAPPSAPTSSSWTSTCPA